MHICTTMLLKYAFHTYMYLRNGIFSYVSQLCLLNKHKVGDWMASSQTKSNVEI